MQIRIIYNFKPIGWLRFGGITIYGITIYPFVLIGGSFEESKSILEHELIHVGQVRRIGWFRFYSSYLLYYFAGLLEHWNHEDAYFNIPYEIEAYARGE